MRFDEQINIKLYAYEDSAFVPLAIIDDYQDISFSHNFFEAGDFTITINYNIPNALKFKRGLFVQFGDDPYMFGEIISITDSIGSDGKGSQIRTIYGKDARYLFKKRIIKDLNNSENWEMTAKGELCLRNLVYSQCGEGTELKRRLPITNVIPASESAIGKEYSVAESYTNLYDVLVTIATQSEIGWRIRFDGTLTLECFAGNDLSSQVQFSTDYDTLKEGTFTDSSESYANTVYVGGKGTGNERDIYEGEAGASGSSPSSIKRYEAWDNQSEMTNESEYEAEALSVLSQYGQTVVIAGSGLAKSPYVFKEQYNIGDIITLSFSGKTAMAQILSIQEHWSKGQYDIGFSFGKPINDYARQMQLLLRMVQRASHKTNSTSSVKWYTIPTESEMEKNDVFFDTIGFTGNVGSGETFTLYWDSEKTGAKNYNVYFKNLAGAGKLTLTTGVTGKTNAVMQAGTYVASIYVDAEGNINITSATPTNLIEEGNNQPATSDGVYQALAGLGVNPQTLFNLLHPIDEIYIQYPSQKDPNLLYNVPNVISCTWTDITANYDGAFFRTYKSGTSGDFVDNGGSLTNKKQASQNLSHNHGGYVGAPVTNNSSHSSYTSTSQATGSFGVDDGDQSVPTKGFVKYGTGTYSGGGSIDDLNYNSNGYMSFDHSHSYNHVHSISSAGGTEARPDNFAIKVWKRTN